MTKGHRTEWKILDRLKFIFCIEKIEFYLTLRNRNYFLANPIYDLEKFNFNLLMSQAFVTSDGIYFQVVKSNVLRLLLLEQFVSNNKSGFSCRNGPLGKYKVNLIDKKEHGKHVKTKKTIRLAVLAASFRSWTISRLQIINGTHIHTYVEVQHRGRGATT